MILVPDYRRAHITTTKNLMKPNSTQLLGLGLLTALALSSGALASGTHAGGHGDEDTAIGKPGVAAKVSRTVSVEMSDNMRFPPSEIKVKKGETIRFAVKNAGQVKHEFSLGTTSRTRCRWPQVSKGKLSGNSPNLATWTLHAFIRATMKQG